LVARELCDFVETEVLPGTGVDNDLFWLCFGKIIRDFTPRKEKLLLIRKQLQTKIDHWHQQNQNLNPRIPTPAEFLEYHNFLRRIGYLENPVADFHIETENIDLEFSQIAAPQRVVSAQHLDELIAAANGRWGSLYQALYQSDIIPPYGNNSAAPGMNPMRMEQVILYGKNFLDESVPLTNGSHRQAVSYRFFNGHLLIGLENGQQAHLSQRSKFIGFTGDAESPRSILLNNNSLGIEIVLDRESQVGRLDSAGIDDIRLESTPTMIVDCEDSVSSVDLQDKINVYRNWLALMSNRLPVCKLPHTEHSTGTDKLHKPRIFFDSDGDKFTVAERAVLAVRGVGYLMSHSAILDEQQNPISEGIMDAVICSLIAMHDLQLPLNERNSRKQSIYLVLPKIHGSAEVTFTNDLFNAIEDMLRLDRHTVKLGLMDEERRTSLNLKNCIRAASQRLFMTNTGFQDRTADEIHTSMHAGPMAARSAMKQEEWYRAYEHNNVTVALSCGMSGRGQIGKGMWEQTNRMAEMLKFKISQLMSGATAGWVPTPQAAVLHALHYHRIEVIAQHEKLAEYAPATIESMLRIPFLLQPGALTPSIIQAELDSACQCILAYIARWVEMGVGSSTIPDLHNEGKHESRATLRLAAQHLANWLKHNVCSRDQVEYSLQRMARVVDEQHRAKRGFEAITSREDSDVYRAAIALIFEGEKLVNGYTEPLLQEYRLKYKAEHFELAGTEQDLYRGLR